MKSPPMKCPVQIVHKTLSCPQLTANMKTPQVITLARAVQTNEESNELLAQGHTNSMNHLQALAVEGQLLALTEYCCSKL